MSARCLGPLSPVSPRLWRWGANPAFCPTALYLPPLHDPLCCAGRRDYGIDAGAFSRLLMETSRQEVEAGCIDVLEILKACPVALPCPSGAARGDRI